jgi:D-alanyl-D-alanine carboxypeptidase
LRLTFRLLALIILLVAGPVRAADGPAYVLFDVRSGAVLESRASDRLWQPASLTKLMTAYLAFKALKAGTLTPTSPVKISANALAQAPAKMGFKLGTIVNVDNALKMMLVKSANDIAVAMAETIGGSPARFVAMMNAEAQRLGMASTHYDNPNGLPDDGQITTARDLAVLARALWNDFPERRDLFRIPAIQVGKRVLRSQNVLLERYHGANGMKTGFVCASGYNMVAGASRFGRQLMVVVLGASSSKDRAETAAVLLNKGFGNVFGGAHAQLAGFKAGPGVGPLVNMRSQVCSFGGNASDEEDNDPLLASVGAGSALEPRFQLMAPVPVYTGRADVAGGPAVVKSPAPAGKVPLPRLRPTTLSSNAPPRAFAEEFEPSPAAIAINPPLDLTQMH